MYKVGMQKKFIADHHLLGDASPEEKVRHSHHYCVDLEFSGYSLDAQGYLLNIDHLDIMMTEVIAKFKNSYLNELPEFENCNPSIEHFSRILADHFSAHHEANLVHIKVLLWEDDIAWASYEKAL
ncbi:MAG: 6-pyruvoyl tetrahydropterin synthase family protein [Oligoflexales bacterium]